MKGARQWLWLGMCGLVWAGCIEPMGAMSEEEAQREQISALGAASPTATTPPPVLPPVLWLSSTTDVSTLWRNTTSTRKHVLLVAYTLPKDPLTGLVGPPRFRAFGVDLSRNAYVFVADGERQSLLGSFTEAMFAQDALVIATPPGTTFFGECAPVLPPGTSSRGVPSGAVRALGSEDGTGDAVGRGPTIACATEPVVRVPVTTGENGHDPFEMLDPVRLMDLPRALNAALLDFQVPGATLFGP